MKVTDYTTNSVNSDVITFAAGRLGIPEDVELVIVNNEAILDKFSSGDVRMDAVLLKMSVPGMYQMILRKSPKDPIVRILMHETVHLSQYVSGDLSLDLERNIFTWKGKTYGKEVDYFRRPWEVEAFKTSDRLLKEWKAEQKKSK